jgi:uncharacterized membrane protein
MLVLGAFLGFSLVIVIVQMTVTGWPEIQPKLRFEVSFYLSLLGIFGILGSLLFIYLEPWSTWFNFSSLLMGIVLLGMAFPSCLAYRQVRGETDATLSRTPLALLHKSAGNSLAVALAAVVSLLIATWQGAVPDSFISISGWSILFLVLITHNISTIYYLQKQHSE